MSDLIGQHLGPYRIMEQIGVGGMATVYRAFQPAMDRYVAVKVIASHFAQDPTFLRRFRREARAIAQLEHAHILPVHDYGEAEGLPYLVMRYLEAGTLEDRLEQGVLSLLEVNRIIGQVGGALDYAHRVGIIHRDVKPSNVLVDAEGNTYLTDFGLAKMLGATTHLTGTGVGIGTPAYMSPEQGQGMRVDARTDVYSLGVMLYRMVTGRVPYDAETPLAIVLKHVHDPLPLPRSIRPDLPEGVERVILRAMAKEPVDRFQTVKEMVYALDAAVRAAEAAARTEPKAKTLPKPGVAQAAPRAGVRPSGWPRWLRWTAGGVGALAVLLLLGLAFGWWGYQVGVREGQLVVIRPAPGTPAVTATPAPSTGVPTVTPIAPTTVAPAKTATETAPTPAPAKTPTAATYPFSASNALYLDGLSGYVRIPYDQSLDLAEAFTLEAWVKSECQPTLKEDCTLLPIISQSHSGSSIGNYMLALRQNMLMWGFQPALHWDILFTSSTSIGSGWHHLAAVHVFGQSTLSRLYLDGVRLPGSWGGWDGPGSVNSDAMAFSNSREAYLIGRIVWDSPPNYYFSGWMDEVRIWRVARTETQIRSAMYSELTGQEEDMVAYWKFDEAVGAAVAHDSSPNGNDGSLQIGAEIRATGTLSSTAGAITQAEQARAFGDPILAATAGRTPDYEDDFSDPGSGWPVGSDADGSEWGYEDGAYYVLAQNGQGGLQPDNAPWVSDFVLEVDGQFVSGERGCWYVDFRVQQDGCWINLYPNGDFEVYSSVWHEDVSRHEQTSLARGRASAFEQGIGTVNRLTIVAQGPQIAFYVNGEPLWFVYDGLSPVGSIGLGVYIGSTVGHTPLRVHFDNLRIWDITDLPVSTPAP